MGFAMPDPEDPTAMVGLSYAGLFVLGERGSVFDLLTERRFSGWLGPQEDAWILIVPESGGGAVAGDGTTLTALAADLARELGTVTVAARVEFDRVLRLNGWDGTDDHRREDPEDLGAYVSDPSADAEDDEETYPEPDGAHHAPAYVRACRPAAGDEVAEELEKILAEELDTDAVFESERLDAVLRLLGLPRWLISSDSLPGDVPAGPRRQELTRLGAGREGVPGRLAGRVASVLRRRRRTAE